MTDETFLETVKQALKNSEDPELDSKIGAIFIKGATCNSNCKYCFIDAPEHKNDICQINSEAIANTLKPFKKESGYIEIFGGEPLFGPNKDTFIQTVNLVNDYVPNAKIHITTNAILLNDWWADYFREHNLYVNISHDGPGQKYRGLNYFESTKHVKVIQKLMEIGHLLEISTTVHKYNCSFPDIYNFFQEVKNKTGIKPKAYRYSMVGPNTHGIIPFDWDYMDKSLINYVQDNFKYLLESAIPGSNIYYSSRMIEHLFTVLEYIIHPKVKDHIDYCLDEDTFGIDTLGHYRCFRKAFFETPKEKLKKDHDSKCLKCKYIAKCIVAECPAITLSDELCKTIQNRIDTIEFAIKGVLQIWQNL